MRFVGLAAVCTALFAFASPAHANISADLKFCATLKSSKERLACYDAAARIEERGTVAASVTAQQITAPLPPTRSTLDARASVLPPPPASRFEGAFIAVTGGYDFAARNRAATPYFPYFGSSFAGPTFVGEQSLPASFDNISSPKLGLNAGYNVTSGPLLLGFEGRGFYAFGGNRSGYSMPYTAPQIPFVTQSGSCGVPCSFPQLSGPQTGSFPVGPSVYRFSERYSRPLAGDLALRGGIVFGDWLMFGKIGGGLEQSKQVTVSDSSSQAICVSPYYTYTQTTPSSYSVSVTSCGAITNGARSVTTQTRYSPYAILGTGFERNFGPWFARAEAELGVHFPYQTGEAYYAPSASMAVGYRF